MTSGGIFERSYPGYDVDELIFDLDDSDFGNELVQKGFSTKVSFAKNLDIHIRHSKSDSLLVSGYGFLKEMDEGNLTKGNLLPWLTLSSEDESRSNCSLEGVMENIEADPTILTLEGLRTEYSSCFSCGVSWREGHVSLDCSECGGYSMQRPCPACDGQCKNLWNRDLAKSHKCQEATWEGECKLYTREPLSTTTKTQKHFSFERIEHPVRL